MKKFLLCVLTVLTLVTLSGCSEKKTYEYTLTAGEVIDKIENGDTFVVYLGTTTCSHCQAFGKLVPEYNKKYDLEISHVVLDESEVNEPEEYSALMELMPIEYTPTTFFIVDGEIKDSVVGALEEDEIVEYLVEYGFVEEGAK